MPLVELRRSIRSLRCAYDNQTGVQTHILDHHVVFIVCGSPVLYMVFERATAAARDDQHARAT